MSVLSANKLPVDTITDDWEGNRAYTERWQIFSDDPDESPVAIRAFSGVPQSGFVHDYDSAAYVKNRSFSRDTKTRTVWYADVNYEFSRTDPLDSPLDDPVRVRWTYAIYTRPVVKDNNGEAILNSAGDFFDPPPEKDYVMWTANIQWNEASRPPGLRSFAGGVNASSVTIDGDLVAAQRAKVSGLDVSDIQVRNDVEFVTVTVAIDCLDDDDPNGFDLSLIDQGFRFKDGSTQKDILIEDSEDNKARPSSPVLLNGSGQVLTNPSPATAVFLGFEILKYRDLTFFPGVS